MTGTCKVSISSIDIFNEFTAVAKLYPLALGTYLIRKKYNGNILALSPLTVAGPSLSSINPSILPTNQWSQASQLTVTGTGFGLDPSKLSLKMVNDAIPAQVNTISVSNNPTGLTLSTTVT